MNINLNQHDSLYLYELPYGETRQISVKLGQRHYFVDIDKCAGTAFVDFYLDTDKSKYLCSVALGVKVKENAILDRTFFKHIADIKAAQTVMRDFASYLN